MNPGLCDSLGIIGRRRLNQLTEVWNYGEDVISPIDAVWRNGWPGLVTLLDRGTVQSWGPVRLLENIRRGSMPAVGLVGFHLENASRLLSSKDKVEGGWCVSLGTLDNLYSDSGTLLFHACGIGLWLKQKGVQK